jgi:hypothetical protein
MSINAMRSVIDEGRVGDLSGIINRVRALVSGPNPLVSCARTRLTIPGDETVADARIISEPSRRDYLGVAQINF